jgi:class 3 adenylate cyclase
VVERTTARQFGTVLFTDIVNSTEQSASVGDARWREVFDAHDRTTRALIDEHRGRVVKSTGDGLLAVFDAPSQGVDCALEMSDDLGAVGIETGGSSLSARTERLQRSIGILHLT